VIRCTLVADGPSDRRLEPALLWTLMQHTVQAVEFQVADVRLIHRNGRQLASKLAIALELYPADVFFIHRDAEADAPEDREEEIRRAVATLVLPPHVAVIPVRMQETWLLINERALRQAAGNPRGRTPLSFPRVRQLEALRDPKILLADLLRAASEFSGRRLQRFDIGAAIDRLSTLIGDYAPLRELPAFSRLEAAIEATVNANGW
jgi:hypothetical protein